MSEEAKTLEVLLAKPSLSQREICDGLVLRAVMTLQGYHKKTDIQSSPEEVKEKIWGYMKSAFNEIGTEIEQGNREQFEKVREIVDYEIQLFRIEVVDDALCDEHNSVCEALLKKFPS